MIHTTNIFISNSQFWSNMTTHLISISLYLKINMLIAEMSIFFKEYNSRFTCNQKQLHGCCMVKFLCSKHSTKMTKTMLWEYCKFEQRNNFLTETSASDRSDI